MSEAPEGLAHIVDHNLAEAREDLKTALAAGWDSDAAALAMTNCEASLVRARLATLDLIRAASSIRRIARKQAYDQARARRRGHRAAATIYAVRDERGRVVRWDEKSRVINRET